MPESPPKRITRARAAALAASKAPGKPIKSSAASAKPVKVTTTRVVKRKSPADEIEEPLDVPVLDVMRDSMRQPNSVKPVRATRASKVAVLKVQPGQLQDELLAATAKPAKSTVKSTVKSTATDTTTKTTRARITRKAVQAITASETLDVVEMRRQATQGQASTTSKPLIKRKKVMFQQDQADKENRVPSPVVSRGKVTTRATGIQARPVRRPAVTRTTRRSKKVAEDGDRPHNEVEKPEPLSPKKVRQVGTGSISSEDELASMNLPISVLYRSPKKDSNATRPGLSDSRLISSAGALSAPSLGLSSAPKRSLLASPARRPPQSPFKDSVKESPKRPTSVNTIVSLASIKPLAHVLDPTMAAAAPPSSKKTSLLQSPARRPQSSPSMHLAFTSPRKTNMGPPTAPFSAMQASDNASNLTSRELLPRKNLINYFGALRAPDKALKTTQLTPAKTTEITPAQASTPPMDFEPGSAIGTSSNLVIDDEDPMIHEEAWVSEETPCKRAGFAEQRKGVHRISSASVKIDGDEMTIAGHSAVKGAPSPSSSPILELPIQLKSPVALSSARSTERQIAAPQLFESIEDMMKSSPLSARLNTGPSSASAAPGSAEVDDPKTPLLSLTPEDRASPVCSRKLFEDVYVTPTPANDTVDFVNRTPLSVVGQTRAPKSMLRRQAAHGAVFAEADITRAAPSVERAKLITMTPLIRSLESLKVSSPVSSPRKTDEIETRSVETPMGIFSFRSTMRHAESDRVSFSPKETTAAPVGLSPAKPTFFEDEMSIRFTDHGLQAEDAIFTFTSDALSETSEEYGDENIPPDALIDPILLAADTLRETASTPELTAASCTPARIFGGAARVIHTVSKVPLRPAAEDTPSTPSNTLPLRRAKSLNSKLSRAQSQTYKPTYGTTSPLSSDSHDNLPLAFPPSMTLTEAYCTPTKPCPATDTNPALIPLPSTPACASPWSAIGDTPSLFGTPTQTLALTPRALPNPTILRGAIVHVDVHTTEGADVSSLFTELLTQMGARCIKRWSWTPSPSLTQTPTSATPGNNARIGITHVVFKDGSPRTLEKVRATNSKVHCVGVSWILDCEQQSRWVEETPYEIDTTIVPRGGNRRRKSMEPRSLTTTPVNDNLRCCPSSTHPSPTAEFLQFSSPTRRESTLFVKVPDPTASPACVTPGSVGGAPDEPETPYYLRPAELVQMSCPPKMKVKMGRGLGGLWKRDEEGRDGGAGDDVPEGVRMRLLVARRKSLQWAPKVGSPLGRGTG